MSKLPGHGDQNKRQKTNQNRLTMSMTRSVSFVSNAFFILSLLFLIYLLALLSIDELNFLMMSLMMIGMDPGPLIRALFHFPLMNLLVLLENPLFVFMA